MHHARSVTVVDEAAETGGCPNHGLAGDITLFAAPGPERKDQGRARGARSVNASSVAEISIGPLRVVDVGPSWRDRPRAFAVDRTRRRRPATTTRRAFARIAQKGHQGIRNLRHVARRQLAAEKATDVEVIVF